MPAGGDAAYLGRVALLPAPAEHAAAPSRGMGPERFGGADVPPERRLADLENSLEQVKLDPPKMCHYLRRCSISRCRQNACLRWLLRNCGADNWRR